MPWKEQDYFLFHHRIRKQIWVPGDLDCLKDLYVKGEIELDEFEEKLPEALKGRSYGASGWY